MGNQYGGGREGLLRLLLLVHTSADERGSGVKLDMRGSGDVWVVREACVFAGIFGDEDCEGDSLPKYRCQEGFH